LYKLRTEYSALKKFSEDFRKLWKKIMLQKVPEGFSTALENSKKFKKVLSSFIRFQKAQECSRKFENYLIVSINF
jgi:hypothetical protein